MVLLLNVSSHHHQVFIASIANIKQYRRVDLHAVLHGEGAIRVYLSMDDDRLQHHLHSILGAPGCHGSVWSCERGGQVLELEPDRKRIDRLIMYKHNRVSYFCISMDLRR